MVRLICYPLKPALKGMAYRNAPYPLGIRAVVYALAAGNTTVLKGPELSPRCYWAIGSVLKEAGLPDGCLNVLVHRTQDAAEITTLLIEHPAVKKINFTGSTAVGKIVAATAGKSLKPCLMELGGKASAIVLPDANLEKAASACALGAFSHVSVLCLRFCISLYGLPTLSSGPASKTTAKPSPPERPNLHVHRTHHRPLLHRSHLHHPSPHRHLPALPSLIPRPHPGQPRHRKEEPRPRLASLVQRRQDPNRRHRRHRDLGDAHAPDCGGGGEQRDGYVLHGEFRAEREFVCGGERGGGGEVGK